MKNRTGILCHTIADKLGIAAEILSTVGLFVCLTLMLTQVILRYIFSSGLSWGEEITRYTMIWVAMLSGSILVKNRELIKVDFLDTLWSPRFIKCRDIVSYLLFVCAYLVIIVQGWKQAHYALTAGSRMISVDANFFWAYLAMPVGAAIMAVQLILSIVLKMLSEKNSGQ